MIRAAYNVNVVFQISTQCRFAYRILFPAEALLLLVRQLAVVDVEGVQLAGRPHQGLHRHARQVRPGEHDTVNSGGSGENVRVIVK